MPLRSPSARIVGNSGVGHKRASGNPFQQFPLRRTRFRKMSSKPTSGLDNLRFDWHPVLNEFYKKGCQEKNSASTSRLSCVWIRRSRSRKVRYLRGHARMHRGRTALIVDHMADFAVIPKSHGNDVMELYPRS